MAVSSSSDFTITKRQLIERSYRIVGAMKSGDTASASQISDANIILNSIVRELDAKRLGVWLKKQSTFTTVAGQTSYAVADGLPNDIFYLESALYVVASNDERPVTVSGYFEYDKVNDKTVRGDPSKIFLSDDTDLTARTAKLWPIPDAAKTVKLRYRRRIYDFDSDIDNPDFPAEWFGCLAFLLAAEIAEEYVSDNDKVKRIIDIGQIKLRDIKAMSVKSTENPKEKNHEYY